MAAASLPSPAIASASTAVTVSGVEALWPLGVPIDHVLTSPELRVHDFRVLDSIGSDHRPIAVEFSLCG